MSVAPRLSPQARALLDSVPARAAGELSAVEAARHDTREQASTFGGPREPVAAVDALDAGGVPARLYRPRGGERAVLVWLHGGGWSSGDLDCYDAFSRSLALRAGCAVLSVDYRLAPEHAYPAATDDAWAATRWAAERFERVAVGGDSAGGNLAAVVALRARDAQLELASQLLVYPMLDPALASPHVDDFVARYTTFGAWPSFGATVREDLRVTWERYVPDPAQRAAPDAAPARAASLAGLPPATFVFAEHDILRGEGEAFARRLGSEAVAVEVHHYPEQIHGFYHLLALDDARDAVERSARALRRDFAR